MPTYTDAFIDKVRSLAFLEFLKPLKNEIFVFIGVCTDCGEGEICCKDAMISELGIFILAFTIIGFLCIILVLLKLFKDFSNLLGRLFLKLKNILLFNSFIRALQLGTLKI